ncbi:MAG: Arsenical resistance operon repressor, partial [uncultured Nocardioidaceae bacterium]
VFLAPPRRVVRVLRPACPQADGRRPGRHGRRAAEGTCGPGPTAPDVDRVVPHGRRGVRVRPDRRLRLVPADDQPPPQGPARSRAARARQARRLGLLPCPPRGLERARRPLLDAGTDM